MKVGEMSLLRHQTAFSPAVWTQSYRKAWEFQAGPAVSSRSNAAFT